MWPMRPIARRPMILSVDRIDDDALERHDDDR
jgi:hypothetical protein